MSHRSRRGEHDSGSGGFSRFFATGSRFKRNLQSPFRQVKKPDRFQNWPVRHAGRAAPGGRLAGVWEKPVTLFLFKQGSNLSFRFKQASFLS